MARQHPPDARARTGDAMLMLIAASDLTDRSAAVLPRALSVAAQTGGRVIFVHVAPDNVPEARIADLRRRMEEVAAQTSGGSAAEIRVIRGRPELALPDMVETEAADLLILGLHRVRPVLDLLRLTTMERIVLRADIPVLVAHVPAGKGYRKVLGCVDFAPACAAALAAAGRIAPHAEFHAIHALQVPLRDKFSPGGIEDSRAMTQAEVLRSAFLASPGLPPDLHLPEIVPGGVHAVLGFRVDELEPDLITIGTHSGRDPGVLGNYARDLMRDPPADVLVTKPPRPSRAAAPAQQAAPPA